MANDMLKEYAKLSGVKLWQIANELGMHDSNFSKLLRHPLPEEKEAQICAIIDRLAANRKDGNDE